MTQLKKFRPATRRMALALGVLLTAHALHAQTFTVLFEFNQRLQGTNATYLLNPFITATPTPITYHRIESPSGAFKGNFAVSSPWITNALASSLNYNSFAQVLQEVTNGLWTVTLNRESASPTNYFFRVTNVAITTNTFGQPQILFPPNGIQQVPKNSSFFWIGPSNYAGLFLQIFSSGNINIFSNANPAQFTLPFPPTMPVNTNVSFQISYLDTNAISTLTTTPTNSSGGQLLGFNVSTKLLSRDTSVFTVSSNYICQPAPSGLVAWFKAEGNANDSAGANNGTLQNGVTFTNGEVGQAFQFDGMTNGVLIGNPANLQLQDFTIDAWIKRDRLDVAGGGPSSQGGIVAYGHDGYAFGMLPDGQLFLSKVDINSVASGASLKVADTNFHHVAVTKSGSAVIFYIDGIAGAPMTYNAVFAFTKNLSIGARLDLSQPSSSTLTATFAGLIDEVDIFNRPLSPAEIQSIYNAGSAGKCDPLPRPKVAIYAAEEFSNPDFLSLTNKLLATGLFDQVDLYSVRANSGLPVPTLAELQQYNAVLVYSDYPFNTNTALGDVLADYSDAGGGVVVAQFALAGGVLGGDYLLAGRLAVDGYIPFAVGSTNLGFSSGFVADIPDHPIIQGIPNPLSSYRYSVSTTLGSTLIAHWPDGSPLVATKQLSAGRIVGLNLWPTDAFTNNIPLIANALSWSAGSGGGGSPDVTQYLVVKGQLFTQTNSTPVAQTTNAAINFSVSTPGFPASIFVTNASVVLPNSNVVNLIEQSDAFEFQDSRLTTGALNSAYPNGTYTVNILTMLDGNFSVPLSLTGDTYPDTPTILNFSTTQSIDPFSDLTLSWGAFTGGTANDLIQVRIKEVSVVSGDMTVFETGDIGEPGRLDGTATSVLISAGTLEPGKTYQAELLFGKLVTQDTTSYPGVLGFTAYFKRTEFDMVTAGAVGKVAIYGAESDDARQQDVRDKIQGTGLFGQVDLFHVESPNTLPTLGELQQYDAVLVYSQNPFNNTAAFGNVLADYVDSGGGLVVATFAFYDQNGNGIGIEGRIQTGGYLPFTQADQAAPGGLTLVKDIPDHPILQDIFSFDGGTSSFHNSPVAITNGAMLVAHWSNGQPLVGAKELPGARIVGLNLFPPSSDSGSGWDSSTDGALLMANALLWASGNSGGGLPDVRNYLLAKGQRFKQTGTTPSAQTTNAAITMSVNTRDFPASSFVSSASVTLSNRASINLTEENDSFEFQDERLTTSSLNTAYPNGTYTFNIQTVHDGNFSVPLSLTGDTYPNTPTILNFSGSQAVNPFTDYTLSWGAFTGGTSNDFIQVQIQEVTANGENTVFKTADNPGEPGGLDGKATSVVIPANTFVAAKTYQARLLFAKIVAFNATSYPGVPGFSAYFKETEFNVVTAGSATVPLITNERLPGRQVNMQYSAQLMATGGTGGFTWSITAGALPAGITLSTAGVLSGTPTANGTFTVTIRVRDSASHPFSQIFSITIYPTPPGFPIATSMEGEFTASGAFDGTNYLVAIQGDSNSPASITAQFVAPNGTLVGGRINVGRTGAQPSVAFGSTNYLLVWQDDATAPSDDIYGQLISRSGQLVGVPFPISDAVGQQELDSFQHVIFTGGNFFVAWRDGRTASFPGDGPTYVYGQFVSPAGNLVGSDIQISDAAGRAPGLGFDGNNILIAWNEDDNNTDIYGQFIDINAQRVSGDNFVIDANSLFSDEPVDVAFDGSRFLIAFHDEVSENNWDLFARFADAETGAYPDRLTIADGAVDQHFPRVVNRSGRFFVAWLEGLGGTAAAKTKARFFEPDGTASAEFVLIDNTSARVPFTGIVGGGKKLLAVTDWLAIGAGNDGIDIFDGDVYGQFFSIGPPQILVQPKSRTVTTGSTVNFGVLAIGTPPLRFQWQFNGANIPGATNASFVVPNAQPANEGSYTVVVANAFGDITSDAATLTVLAPPMITMQPVSQIVAVGANVTFSVSATGGGTITYQWRLNGVNIPGETGSSLTLLNVQPSNNGNYAVVVGNEIAAVDSQIARLFVTADALGLADNFADRVITNSFSGVGSGSNVFATKEIGEPNHAGNPGGASVWYAWQAPATGIATFTTLGSSFDTLLAVYTGTNVNSLTLIARDNDRAGYLTSRVMFNAISNEVYNIAIDGSYGASGDVILSWSLEVTANLLPEILVQPQSQIVAQGSNATLTVVANNNAGPLAYQWFFKGDPISGATDSSFTIFNVQASNSGPYRVLISTFALSPRSVLSAAALVQLGELATVIALDKFLDVTPLGSGQPGQNSLIGQLRGNHGHPNAAPAGGFTGTQIFNTFGATKEPGEPNHCGVPGGASYWYAYQAPAAGRLFVNTSNSTFDTVLAIYTGPATITSFSDIVSVDCANEPGFGTESLSVAATNGETFYLVVDGVGGTSGVVTLNFNLVSSPSIIAQPQSKAVTPGSNVTFTVNSTGGGSLAYQWRLNGNDIADATDSAYTFVASNAAVAGLYSVVVSNDASVVVSSVATLTVVGETTRPKVAITSPAEGSRASNTVVTVSGTASDNAGIYQVLWQINGGDNQVADGTTNWSASVPLNPGTNTFRVYSVDTSGNTASPTNSRKFVYVVLQPFTLTTNGTGTVTPGQGGQMLEIGKNYTVTASPGAGQLFINWSEGSSSTNPVLTFTMQTNFMLQANFLANPFIQRSGTYSGLFYQTNVVAHQSSGFFTLTVSSSGAFSCKLLTAGLKPSAKGVFTFEGFANVNVTRKGLLPLAMSLVLDVTNQTGKVLGTVSDGNWVAALEGDRAVFNATTNIAPQNGKYTLAFVHQTSSATIPGGDGVGTVTVDTAGKLALKGTLADGVKASQKTVVSKQGQWPFYLNLYSGQGSTIGWLLFTNRGTSSIEGDVSWIKTGVVPGKNYFAGFTNEVIGAGSRYPNPVPAGRILNITNGEVILSANNLDPSLTNGIFLNTNNAVTVTSGSNNLKLTLTASSGAVKGTFTHPTNLATTKITGIILPEQNVVRGFFLNSTNSGAVIFQGQ